MKGHSTTFVRLLFIVYLVKYLVMQECGSIVLPKVMKKLPLNAFSLFCGFGKQERTL